MKNLILLILCLALAIFSYFFFRGANPSSDDSRDPRILSEEGYASASCTTNIMSMYEHLTEALAKENKVDLAHMYELNRVMGTPKIQIFKNSHLNNEVFQLFKNFQIDELFTKANDLTPKLQEILVRNNNSFFAYCSPRYAKIHQACASEKEYKQWQHCLSEKFNASLEIKTLFKEFAEKIDK